jgi:hypothetical protein
LYTDAGDRLDENYRDGTSSDHIALVLATGIAALALFLGVQVFLARRCRRILNVPLVAATLIVFAVVTFTLLRVVSAQNSLVHAQRNGSDPVQLLSASSILAFQAQADEDLALTEHGTGQLFLDDFDAVMKRLGGARGQSDLLGATRVAARAGATITDVDALSRTFVDLRGLHRRVRGLDDRGLYTRAVALATGRDAGREASLFGQFDAAIQRDLARAERVLYSEAADARSGFGALAFAIPVLLLLSGGLVFGGLQRRIAEYS